MMSHSHLCYSRQYKKQNLGKPHDQAGPLRIATCMVIEDVNGKVLLTMRSRKMRVFPRAWVLPGGHLDPGETLEACAVREIKEETGINIQMNSNASLSYHGKEVTLAPYFIYESSISQLKTVTRELIKAQNWTAMTDLSKPPTCHLIINFFVKLGVPASEISLSLCTKEVEASIWLTQDQLISVFCSLKP